MHRIAVRTLLLNYAKKLRLLFYCATVKSCLERPVFLIGCGRSGTTILGTTLSLHPDITYLNEPRDIWTNCYPQTDIWSEEAPSRNGKLNLTASMCTPKQNKRLRSVFYSKTLLSGKPRLLEKLPINTFRLEFISSVFPDALFIHIVRNGLEVARSIEQACNKAEWFGVNGYKWQQLVNYAANVEKFNHLPELCRTNYEKGLMEWRLSVETALDFFELMESNKILQVSYEDLLETPPRVLYEIESFIDIPKNEHVHAFANKKIQRKTSAINANHISGTDNKIVGNLLKRLNYITS